jgi:hypothetical protein
MSVLDALPLYSGIFAPFEPASPADASLFHGTSDLTSHIILLFDYNTFSKGARAPLAKYRYTAEE